MKVVVIGGIGLVGWNVVRRLIADGHEVTTASRRTGVDIITGVGLAKALFNADVVVDASNSPILEGPEAFEFFKTAGANLVKAEIEAGVKHHVALSVVGAGRLDDSPYFRGKASQEEAIRTSGIPFTIVHATQFFEFLLDIVELSLYDQALRLPPAYIQPVASADVAATMAELAIGSPRNALFEVAGPECECLPGIIQRFLSEIEAPYEVISDASVPYFGAILEDHSLLPNEGARICPMGFIAWLGQSEYRGAKW